MADHPLTLIPIAAGKADLIIPLFIISVFWGNWHVAKQHFGFVMLYKRKNAGRGDITIDKWFVLLSQTLPFVMFVLWYLSIPVFGRGILGVAILAQSRTNSHRTHLHALRLGYKDLAAAW